jgi:hypothetical protein
VQKLINISQARLGFIQFLDEFGGFPVNTNTKAPFGCADKLAEKHCWLIYCERKILFRLKNKLKNMDYKPDE